MTQKKKALAVLGCLAAFAFASAGVAFSAPSGPAASSFVPPIDEKKIEDITKAVAPSVVRVEVRNGIRKVATGVVIDKDGSIVTTALISPHDEEITVITADGKKIKADFKGFDTQTQLALIQAKDKSLAPIALGKSGDLKPGAWIGVVGLSPENTPAVTQGIVSSVAVDRLRLNVWVVPGSSGSPVVDGNGQMVGLLRGAYAEDQPVVFEFREQQVVGSGTVFSRAEAPSSGMALAVPMDIVASIAADLKKSGKVERGWLGVSVAEKDGKIEIASIDPKSPAELAKLKEGDLILKIDGKDITSGPTLSSEIRGRKPGQDVMVRIERDGKPLDVKLKLGEYTEVEAQRELELNFPRFFKRERIPSPTMPLPAPRGAKPERQTPPYYNNTIPRSKTAPLPRNFYWQSRKFIGVSLQELNKELAEYFGLKGGVGLLVAQVEDKRPAQKAGLKVGDVILKADGKEVETPAALSEMIQGGKKGDKIKLDILRDKKGLTLEVEIAEEESSSATFKWTPDEDFGGIQDRLSRLQKGFRPDVFPEIEGNLKKMEEDVLKKIKETEKPSPNMVRIMRDGRNLIRL